MIASAPLAASSASRFVKALCWFPERVCQCDQMILQSLIFRGTNYACVPSNRAKS